MTTENTETTEADRAERMAFANEYMVPTEVARRLERERDEARDALRELWQSADAYIPTLDPKCVARWRKIAGLKTK